MENEQSTVLEKVQQNTRKFTKVLVFCWTDLDKVHRLIDRSRNIKSCKLTSVQRSELHKYPILQAEINIIKPTHIIFFGWYGVSFATGIAGNIFKII